MNKILSLLTIIILFIGCVPHTERTIYPVEEFILVKKTLFINVCNKIINKCKDDNFIGSGSGVVIRHRGTKSYILTAEHVCASALGKAPIFVEISLKETKIKLTNSRDKTKAAKIFATDTKHDLCILETERMNTPAIKISKRSPKRYDKVYNVAAPRGRWTKGNALFFEGYFSGYDEDDEATFILNAMPGSSGSPIVNSHGQLVGIVSKVLLPGYSVVYGASHKHIKKFVKETFE